MFLLHKVVKMSRNSVVTRNIFDTSTIIGAYLISLNAGLSRRGSHMR